MGNEQSGYIKNVDKRTSRLDHKRDFRHAIGQFSGVQERDIQDSSISKSNATNQIQIYARKRPMLFAKEIKKDFDVIDAFPHAIPCPQIVVHDCRMKPNLKDMYLSSYAFPFDGVFGGEDDTNTVYQGSVGPLVDWMFEDVNARIPRLLAPDATVALLEESRTATVFMFGQTGSGKTYTMSGIYQRASEQLFAYLKKFNDALKAKSEVASSSVKAQNKKASNVKVVVMSLSYFELLGKNCYDLLNENQVVRLLEGPHGGTVTQGLTQVLITTRRGMLRAIKDALSGRATSATGVHDASSRSHAMATCSFHLITRRLLKRLKTDDDCGRCGHWVLRGDGSFFDNEMLTKQDPAVRIPESFPMRLLARFSLVDLAGSERNRDSFNHNRERIAESREINTSLMVLKDCFRVRKENIALASAGLRTKPIPFRTSKLTRILKPCLQGGPQQRTAVIATVSPSSGDTEHSMSTLRNVCLVGVNSSGDTDKSDEQAQKKVSTTSNSEWPRVTTVSVANQELLKIEREVAKAKHQRNARGDSLEHPGKWTREMVSEWWCRTLQRLAVKSKWVPKGTKAQLPPTPGISGKELVRWPKARLEQVCETHASASRAREMATCLFQRLRVLMQESGKRKQEMAKARSKAVLRPMDESTDERGDTTPRQSVSRRPPRQLRSRMQPTPRRGLNSAPANMEASASATASIGGDDTLDRMLSARHQRRHTYRRPRQPPGMGGAHSTPPAAIGASGRTRNYFQSAAQSVLQRSRA